MVPLVQILLDAGAKITQSHFLLHYAIMHRHTEMAELLLKAGSIVNLRDDNGDSPLIVAARTGICQLVELLLRNGKHLWLYTFPVTHFYCPLFEGAKSFIVETAAAAPHPHTSMTEPLLL